MSSANLGEPEDWHFMGEGNANAVFSYSGSDPQLVRLSLQVYYVNFSFKQVSICFGQLILQEGFHAFNCTVRNKVWSCKLFCHHSKDEFYG